MTTAEEILDQLRAQPMTRAQLIAALPHRPKGTIGSAIESLIYKKRITESNDLYRRTYAIREPNHDTLVARPSHRRPC